MRAALRELPNQIAVHGPKQQVAPRRTFSRPVHMRQQPMQLGGGKIRIQQKAGLLRDFSLISLCAQTITKRRCAPILPHNCPMDWRAGFAVPHQGCFTLVGNADGRDIFGCAARLLHHPPNNRLH